MLLHLVGILSPRFTHDARSQEHKIFIGVRIIKEMPGSVPSGTHCITQYTERPMHTYCSTFRTILLISAVFLCRMLRTKPSHSGSLCPPTCWTETRPLVTYRSSIDRQPCTSHSHFQTETAGLGMRTD